MKEFTVLVGNTERYGQHMFNEGRLPVLSRGKSLGVGCCRISFPFWF